MPFYPGSPDPYRAWDAPGSPSHTQSLLLLSLQLLSEAALSTDLTAQAAEWESPLLLVCVRTQVYTHMFTGVPTDVCAWTCASLSLWVPLGSVHISLLACDS